jgi:hypothetical protein
MNRVSIALMAALPALIAHAPGVAAQTLKHAHAIASKPSSHIAHVTPPPERPRTAVLLVPIDRPALIGPAVSLAPDQQRQVFLPAAGQQSLPRAAVIRPSSVAPLDPFTVVSRTPSGRVVLTSLRPGAAHLGRRHLAVGHMPYAPPSFQIIGSAGGRHMSTPVRLTHGIKPGRRLKTEPRVVFLKEKR